MKTIQEMENELIEIGFFVGGLTDERQKTNNMNIYGVLSNGTHTDVSKTERGAKQYATRNGYKTVTIRYNCGMNTRMVAEKRNGRWVDLA